MLKQRNLEELDLLMKNREVGSETILSKELLDDIEIEHDLTKYTKVVEVTDGEGTYAYMGLEDTDLPSVPELEKGTDPLGINIKDVPYEIKTYRGALRISTELIQDFEDNQIDYGEMLAEFSKQVDVNTKNREIIALLKQAKQKAVATTDELITHVNTDFLSAYDIKLFLSSSFYNLLDQDELIEYKDGLALFKGKEVIKIDDNKLGAEGDFVGFVGDLERYLHLFDRQFISLKFASHTDFSQPLAIATRFDCQITDNTAGSFVTYSQA